MVIKLEVTQQGNLIGVDEKTGALRFKAEMPKPRKTNEIPRWLNGSYLNLEQIEEEKYTTRMHIA